MVRSFSVQTTGEGLFEITSQVSEFIRESAIREGICTVFVQHTSASLLVQENSDPSVRYDLQAWMNRLVPENDAIYSHVLEGPDDMPAHIKASLTPVSISIPILRGELALGTWQGLYLWEHRRRRHTRHIVVHIGT